MSYWNVHSRVLIVIYMSVCMLTYIDDDITIIERIDDDIYEYLTKIVDRYKNNNLLMYLVLINDSKATYVKLYSS